MYVSKTLRDKLTEMRKTFLTENNNQEPTKLFISHVDAVDLLDIDGNKPETLHGFKVTYEAEETHYE